MTARTRTAPGTGMFDWCLRDQHSACRSTPNPLVVCSCPCHAKDEDRIAAELEELL